MRIASDGFLDIGDSPVRTPGKHEERLDPLPEGEALAYLLSHAFPGSRRIVRSPTVSERTALRRAMWSGSVNERMSAVDRVWRSITRPATVDADESGDPVLIQVVLYGNSRVFPLYLVRGTTRVLRNGESPSSGDLNGDAPRIDLQDGHAA